MWKTSHSGLRVSEFKFLLLDYSHQPAANSAEGSMEPHQQQSKKIVLQENVPEVLVLSFESVSIFMAYVIYVYFSIKLAFATTSYDHPRIPGVLLWFL